MSFCSYSKSGSVCIRWGYIFVCRDTLAGFCFQSKSLTLFLDEKSLTKQKISIISAHILSLAILSMICYSIKKEGETNEKLILRYKKSFFQTRTANKLKASQNHMRKVSDRKLREKAIIREYYRSLAK